MQRACKFTPGVKIHGMNVNNLKCADDINELEEIWKLLQDSLDTVNHDVKRYDQTSEKQNFGDKTPETALKKISKIDVEDIETLNQFVYLGSLITPDNDCFKEIRRRIVIENEALDGLQKIWKITRININAKKNVLQTYVAETRTLKKTNIDRLNAFEMKW